MSIDIDFDEFAEGTARVLGAAASVEETSLGYSTRGEVANVLGEDYQHVRHRMNQLRDAGILDQNTTDDTPTGQIERRYVVTDEYHETAKTVREATNITGGDLPDEPGTEAFYSVVDELRELKNRIDALKERLDAGADGASDHATAGIDALEERLESLEADLEAVADAQQMLIDRDGDADVDDDDRLESIREADRKAAEFYQDH